MFDERFSLMDGEPGAGGGAPAAPAAPTAPAPSPTPAAPISDAGISTSGVLPSGGNSPASDLDQSLSDSIDSILGSGKFAKPKTSVGDSIGAAAPAPATPEAPVVEPVKPVAADPQAPAEEIDEDLFDDDTDLDSGMEDATKPNLLDLKKTRGQRIYRSYKAYKAITDQLGHEPTPEDIRNHFEAYSDKAAMEDEFLSGDPTKAANFASHWNDLNPQAMAVVTGRLAETLVAKGNTSAYVALAMPVLDRFNKALYQAAAEETNPDMKKALTYTARMVDYRLRGDWRKDGEIVAQPQNTQIDLREAQVNQRFQQIQQYEQGQQAQAQQQWYNSVGQASDSALTTQVDNTLKSLKATLPARAYEATRNDFIQAVKQHVANDADAMRLFNIQLQRTAPTEAGLTQLTNQYMARASRAIRQLAPSLLKEVGVAAVSQNAQQHEALAASAKAGASPNTPGKPAQQSITPTPKQYASQGERFDDLLASTLGNAGAKRR